MQQGLGGSYVPSEQGLGGLAAMMVHSNPELMAKITGGIYKDYDYGADGTADVRGHYSDKGKLPNHPTFSDESMYSGDKYRGGVWSTDDRGNDVFTPSVDMINSGATRGLADYFRRVEPNARVAMPIPYKMTEDMEKVNMPLLRSTYPSEDTYFKNNTHVGGMMTADNKVILNPYTKLNDKERESVYNNESARVFMNINGIIPEFELTKQQQDMLSTTEYRNNPIESKRTIAARIIAGDPSAGTISNEQRKYIDKLVKDMHKSNKQRR